jgi:hypothetical protein
MIEFDFFDNISEFIEELKELLEEDWRKCKLFIKENKNYILWLFITLVTLQFTDILSLGSSWNNYCKKNNIQYGGSNAEPSKIQEEAEPTKSKKELKAEKKQSKADKKAFDSSPEGKKAKADKAASDKATKTEKKAIKKQAAEDAGEDSVKSVDKKLGIFNKLKGNIKSTAGKHGLAGPVLGNLGGVFAAVEGMFYLLAFILIVIGIVSLPFLIFLVLTYSIIKMMCSKLALI